MSSLRNFTLNDLEKLSSHIPSIRGLINLPLVESYDDFIRVLEDDISYCIQDLEENRHVLQNDSEDRLTVQILSNMKCKGYLAEHDAQYGGHVDLLIKHENYKWIGEAKIHSGYDYLTDGFLQLTTRYTVGNHENTHGGLIIYIRGKNARSVMEKWQEHLKTVKCAAIEKLKTEKCASKPLVFTSTHTHVVSGLSFTTKHLPVLLYFSPQDKSGRKKSAT